MAGQFLYVHFDSDKTLEESHPFTISSAPNEEHVRLSIKSSGDWTQHLHDRLKPAQQLMWMAHTVNSIIRPEQKTNLDRGRHRHYPLPFLDTRS